MGRISWWGAASTPRVRYGQVRPEAAGLRVRTKERGTPLRRTAAWAVPPQCQSGRTASWAVPPQCVGALEPTIFFAVELLLELIANLYANFLVSFWYDLWNVFDFAIVFLEEVLYVFGSGGILLRLRFAGLRLRGGAAWLRGSSAD